MLSTQHNNDRPDKHAVLNEHVLQAIAAAGTDPDCCVKALVILHLSHWSPAVVKARGDDIQV